MPLPVIAGVVRCSVRGQNGSGQPWVNVVHARYAAGASTPGSTEIANLHSSLIKFWNGPNLTGGGYWLSRCRSNTTTIDVTYYPLDGSSLGIVTAAAAAGLDPTTTPSPSGLAYVLTLRTAVRGRRTRGRIYLSAPTSALFDSVGDLTSAVRTATIAQWTQMMAELPAKNWELGVASYGRSELSNGTVDTWTPFFTPLASVSMDGKGDHQRRRK